MNKIKIIAALVVSLVMGAARAYAQYEENGVLVRPAALIAAANDVWALAGVDQASTAAAAAAAALDSLLGESLLTGMDSINGGIAGINAQGGVGGSVSLGGTTLGVSISYSYTFVNGNISLKVIYVQGGASHTSYYDTGVPASTVLKNLDIPSGYAFNITTGTNVGSSGKWVNITVPYTISNWNGTVYTITAGTHVVWYFIPATGGGQDFAQDR